jgi:L-lactate utilization protein LutB
MHVVFLDHNRRSLVGTPYEEMLACVRCGACLNVCPVYRRIGGHAYGSTYPGPMGAVLTPLLSAGEEGRDLPDASSLCGACNDACPVEIPLADLLVRLRADLREPGPPVPPVPIWPSATPTPTPATTPPHTRATMPVTASLRFHVGGRVRPRRLTFGAWARLWASPAGYRASTRIAARLGRLVPSRLWRKVPMVSGWAAGREVPLPATRSFRDRWARRAEESW